MHSNCENDHTRDFGMVGSFLKLKLKLVKLKFVNLVSVEWKSYKMNNSVTGVFRLFVHTRQTNFTLLF